MASPASAVAAITTGFEHSPEHAANMLNTQITYVGVGTAYSGNFIYVAEEFMAHRRALAEGRDSRHSACAGHGCHAPRDGRRLVATDAVGVAGVPTALGVRWAIRARAATTTRYVVGN